jgi:hypothetical protein
VPISYYGRTYDQGKKITFKDALAAAWYIIQYNCFTTLAESFAHEDAASREWWKTNPL